LSISPSSADTFDQFGFSTIRSFGKPEVDPDPSIPVTEQTERLRGLSALDLSALAGLKRDMEGWIDHNQRYAAAYLPQVSHGPWDDVSRDGNERDIVKRGRNLSTLLDGWLGELLDVLQRKGRLERTLIVVTGDHGLRDWAEAPNKLSMLMDDYAFHVPLLLYAPGILKHTERIDYVTSHIDIAPSILDLVGISVGRDRLQGAPMWMRGWPRGRRTSGGISSSDTTACIATGFSMDGTAWRMWCMQIVNFISSWEPRSLEARPRSGTP
jgi:arylsulfatase A-like enzyme